MTEPTAGRLTPEQVERFWDDGFVFPMRAFDRAGTERILAGLRRYEDVVDRSDSVMMKMHKHFPKLHLIALCADEVVHNERILDAVESIIGPDILAWSSGIFSRPALSDATLAWHQDVAYFGLRNFDRAVRVWVALTDATRANGTMRFAPGTHKQGVLEHGRRHGSAAQGEEVSVDVDEAAAVHVTISAGEFSMHHLALAHASGANTTDRDRINITVDYFAPEVEPMFRPDSALLVRGEDRHGHYVPEARPKTEFGVAELRAYFDAVAMRDRRIYLAMKEGEARSKVGE